MVELLGRETVDEAQDPFRGGEIAVMEKESRVRMIGIL
jgi:hypothetical protein